MTQKKWKDAKIDRYSALFVMFAIGIILFVFLNDKNKNWGLLLIILTSVLGLLTVNSAARVRQQSFDGDVEYKGENDCGFSPTPKKEIDGLKINNQLFKAGNGTDIVIDQSGAIKPAGFGSWIMIKASKGGYLHAAPDKCWN